MKKCPNCKIYVGGEGDRCPVCQSALMGEGSPYGWPQMSKLRRQSRFYKFQLFVVLVLAFISVALDLLLDVNTGKHWSLPVVVWALVIELLIRHFIKKSVVVASIVTETGVNICVLLLLTAWYMGFVPPIVDYVVPIIVSGLLVTNLVLTVIDKHGNALVYFLINLLVGIIPYVIIRIVRQSVPVPWTVCLMICVIYIIGISVFRGHSVLNEIQKRMSL
jgi:hypothetical protein